MFTTFCLGNFQLEYGDDVDLAYAAAAAHNVPIKQVHQAAIAAYRNA